MNFEPRKKVGSPAAFRGIRGIYLTNMLLYVGGGLFFILIVLIIPFSMQIRLLSTLVAILFLAFKYNNLKKLSKGDLNKTLKDNCRKTFIIKTH